MILTVIRIPNRFELRKKCFDFLTEELAGVADVIIEHPQAPPQSNLPKIAVTLVGNTSKLAPTASVNPEIQITYYATKELELTKPTGLIPRVETLMQEFLRTKIMDEYSNGYQVRTVDCDYIGKIRLYAGYTIYRFYLGS